MQRSKLIVVGSVLLLHGLLLWALHSGLLRQQVDVVRAVVVPITLLAQAPVPPKPEPPPPSVPPKPPVRTPQALPNPALQQAKPVAAAPVQPSPQAAASIAPSTTPTVAAVDAPAVAQAPVAGTVSQAVTQAAAAAPAQPAAPRLELPSSTADYLHNPKPKYPRLSQSRNEQGTVVLGVRVGVDGRVREVVVKTSSGFDLLDRTAREAVLGWTFVPGKRNGVPVEMAVDVPIPFRLTD